MPAPLTCTIKVKFMKLQQNFNAPIRNMTMRRQARLHIAVDINNVHISSQLDTVSGVRMLGIRLRVPALIEIMTAGREVADKFAATTTSESRDKLCQFWSSQGFHVRRLNPDQNGRESGVDETLHAKILQWITTRQYDPEIQPVLILVTGDGNLNHGGTTFLDVLQAAVINGWVIEIFAFRKACSRHLQNFANNCPSASLHYLEKWYNKIIYTKPKNELEIPSIATENSNQISVNSEVTPQFLQEQIDQRKYTGICSSYSKETGFGFIDAHTNEFDTPVFAHHSEIHADGFRFLNPGDYVEFFLHIEQGKKQAKHIVKRLESSNQASSSSSSAMVSSNTFERHSQSSNYRTVECRNFIQGHCRFGEHCAFRHGSSPVVPTTHALAAPPRPASTCCICLDAVKSCVIIPCGHTDFCLECASNPSLTICPICRGPKQMVQRIFL